MSGVMACLLFAEHHARSPLLSLVALILASIYNLNNVLY